MWQTVAMRRVIGKPRETRPIEALIEAVRSGPSENRIAACDELAQRCRPIAETPFDEILDALRALDREPDRAVRQAIRAARAAIVRARAVAIGLRVRATSAQLEPLDDRTLVWASIENVWEAVSIYGGEEQLVSDFARTTPGQRALFSIWWTWSEVTNGGFSQYFANPTGILAPYAVDGCRLVGAEQTAAVVAEAIALFADGVPPDQAERRAALDTISFDELRRLDGKFYATYRDELFARAAVYVRANLTALFME